jgi:hypothetical protein
MQPGGRNAFAHLAALVALLAGLTCQSGEAQESPYSDTEVKAAFLYHFGTYVQWPVERQLDEPITIAVLGAEGVAAELAMFLPGRTLQGRPVVVRRLGGIEDLADEELVFIGSDNNARLKDLIAAIGQRSVLIVTDAPDGLADGGMINFQLVDQRVRFEISLANAEGSGLMLSSRLLSAALRVETAICCMTPREPAFASARAIAFPVAPSE